MLYNEKNNKYKIIMQNFIVMFISAHQDFTSLKHAISL